VAIVLYYSLTEKQENKMNPDAITAPMELVTGFRIVSVLTMSIFWGVLAVMLGSFWDKTRPHESAKITIV